MCVCVRVGVGVRVGVRVCEAANLASSTYTHQATLLPHLLQYKANCVYVFYLSLLSLSLSLSLSISLVYLDALQSTQNLCYGGCGGLQGTS